MAGLPTASVIDAAEYAAIESTMSASERGRWFLAEHARRARAEDTDAVLTAIARLERAVADRPADLVGSLRGDLADMAEAIGRTKAEIAALSPPGADKSRLGFASQALDAVVRSTEQATSDILSAAEAVQETAWSLRERNIEVEICETLDRHATAIYTACSFQDLTAQRIARIIYTLRYLEDRITSMIAIWGTDADRIPAPPDTRAEFAGHQEELCQLDVDRYIAMSVPPVTAAAIAARPGAPALHEDIEFVPVLTPPVEEPAPAEAAAPQAVADLFELAVPDEPSLSLDEIDALAEDERLALFA